MKARIFNGGRILDVLTHCRDTGEPAILFCCRGRPCVHYYDKDRVRLSGVAEKYGVKIHTAKDRKHARRLKKRKWKDKFAHVSCGFTPHIVLKGSDALRCVAEDGI